ncbi:Basal-body rod modification protein flgD [Rickettsiales bacterium Ac37b]|nr:Basal-body rod modification protein flgD [Rickettsiales bacterium Ac37b]
MTSIDTQSSYGNSLQAISAKIESSSERFYKDKEAFLKLLTVQLTNQDPTKPLETNELSQQLISMGAVEQQINTNKLLEELVAANQANKLDKATSYIGHEVELDCSEILVSPDKATKVVYNLTGEAVSNNVEIVDKAGNIIRTFKGDVAQGMHEFYWDGKDDKGKQVALGVYDVRVKAKNASGIDIYGNSKIKGIVKSVKLEDGHPIVVLNKGEEIEFNKITAVHANHHEDLKSYLNKMVEFNNSKIKWDGIQSSTVNLNFNKAEEIAFIKVLDKAGNVVRSKSERNIPAGIHQFIWDGKDNDGKIQPEGKYSVSVVGEFDKPIINVSNARGVVTGINTSSVNPTLTINEHLEIDPKDILSVVNSVNKQDNIEQLKAHINSLTKNSM